MSTLFCLTLLCSSMLPVLVVAQPGPEKKPQVELTETQIAKVNATDEAAIQRQIFAVSLVTSLAAEARSYSDGALRPRVLARAADVLWDTDKDASRLLFRRAWESAETVDEAGEYEGVGGAPVMVLSILKKSGRDLRTEVLVLIGRRDRSLAEEFLTKLNDEARRESADSTNESQPTNDSWTNSEAASKRFYLASRLLEDGEVNRAIEFAAPILDRVTVNSINFLSKLRLRRPETADQRFLLLLSRAEGDPASDANTASGLSSYVFTPGLYITFKPDGGATWSQPEGVMPPPNVPLAIRSRFFQAAANILLRPLPPPDRDFTTSGREGKSMVIKRLLPLFDQYSPDMAVALRTQLRTLIGDGLAKDLSDNNPHLNQGLPTSQSDDTMQTMQERLDHARTSGERDSIYADAAVTLANLGDSRSVDLADKIDEQRFRTQTRSYVDVQLVLIAINKKNPLEAVRLAKAGQLTKIQRVWTYTQAARLLMDSQRQRSVELLAEAADEARRIDLDDPNRALSFIAVATPLVTADPVRAWEIMAEVVKSANATEKFTGESKSISAAAMSRKGLSFVSMGGEELGMSPVFRLLAKADLNRSIELAKSFKNDAPRAAATLAIAGLVLEQ
jgi:hypothetical protein